MKTLGDTKLLPELEKYKPGCIYLGVDSVRIEERNKIITQLSIIPLNQIIEKALDLGLVRIKWCDKCDNIRGDISICNTCRSRGFTITEGGNNG